MMKYSSFVRRYAAERGLVFPVRWVPCPAYPVAEEGPTRIRPFISQSGRPCYTQIYLNLSL